MTDIVINNALGCRSQCHRPVSLAAIRPLQINDVHIHAQTKSQGKYMRRFKFLPHLVYRESDLTLSVMIARNFQTQQGKTILPESQITEFDSIIAKQLHFYAVYLSLRVELATVHVPLQLESLPVHALQPLLVHHLPDLDFPNRSVFFHCFPMGNKEKN